MIWTTKFSRCGRLISICKLQTEGGEVSKCEPPEDTELMGTFGGVSFTEIEDDKKNVSEANVETRLFVK